MLRCENGHYYDEKKYMICPYCGIFAEDEEVTQSYFTSQDSVKPQYSTGVKAEAATVSFQEQKEEKDYVAGWLVCVAGEDMGRDFRIFKGHNYVGRDYDMDIRIENDNMISRRNHCSVVYENRANTFYVMPVENVIYLDGKLLNQAEELKAGQEITVGTSVLVFIPFCGGERKWKTESES